MLAPVQVRSEILQLLKFLDKVRPRTILEIGTARGGTLFLLTGVISKNALVVSLDLPGGRFGGGYVRWKIPLYRSFALPNQKIYLIRKNSHERATLDEVKAVLRGEKVDFLFIDGDHTYEGVKKDFEMYKSLVKKGGTIAFHDIVPHPPEDGCQVNKFWNEIKNRYKAIEFVEDWNQKWGGIGLIKI